MQITSTLLFKIMTKIDVLSCSSSGKILHVGKKTRHRYMTVHDSCNCIGIVYYF